MTSIVSGAALLAQVFRPELVRRLRRPPSRPGRGNGWIEEPVTGVEYSWSFRPWGRRGDAFHPIRMSRAAYRRIGR